MAEKTVKGPDGRVWEVGRQWFPRMPRWKRHSRKRGKSNTDDALDAATTGLEVVGVVDEIPLIGVALAVVALIVLAWVFVIPAMIFLFDVLLIGVIAGIGIALRVLFRRPWKVVAETDDAPAERIEIPVVGYRAAGAKIEEIVYQIEHSGWPIEP